MVGFIKCSNCGNEISGERKFCPFCGNKLSNEEKKISVNHVKKKKKSIIWVLATVFLIVGGVVMGMFFQSRFYEEKEVELKKLVQRESVENKTVEIKQNSKAQRKELQNEVKQTGKSVAEDSPSYTEKYLAVCRNENGKFGYVDTEGNIVAECMYDTAYAFGKDGFARVGIEYYDSQNEEDVKYGMINKNGEIVIPCEYDYMGTEFNDDGYDLIGKYRNQEEEECYYGVLDEYGNSYISPKFESISNIGNSEYFIARDAESKLLGVVNKSLDWVCQPQYDSLAVIRDVNNSRYFKIEGDYALAAVVKYQEGGYAEIVNPLGESKRYLGSYCAIHPYLQHGLLSVKNLDGLCGMIDLNGNEKVPCEYSNLVILGRDESTYHTENGKIFLIDNKGNKKYICDGNYGLKLDDGFLCVSYGSVSGIMNETGNWVVSPEYADCEMNEFYFAGNYAEDGSNGILIDRMGQVVNSSYRLYDLWFASENLIGVGTDSCYGVIDAAGNEIVECRYSDYENISDKWMCYYNSDYSEGVLVNRNGEIMESNYSMYNVSKGEKYISAYQENGKSVLLDGNANVIFEFPEDILFVDVFRSVR